MTIDEFHIDPQTIRDLLAQNIKIHSSAYGLIGDVKLVDNHGTIFIYNKNTSEQLATSFHEGDRVMLVEKSAREYVVKNYVYESEQVDLFTQETAADEAFKEFDRRNPQVMIALVKMSRELKASGHQMFGIQMLFEVIRWRSMLQTVGDDFKLNNNYAGRYARKIMSENADLDGVFELRKLRS
jgi:hypothetical protein